MSRIDELIAELAPNGVEFKTLGDVAIIKTGPNVNKRIISECPGPYPVINSGREPLGYMDQYNTEDDPIGIASRGSVGLVTWTPGKFFRGNLNYSCTVKDTRLMDVRFLYHYLLYADARIQILAVHQGIPALNAAALKTLQVAVPPLEVQREIVRILDQFTQLEAELEAELEARRLQYEHYRSETLSFDSGTRWVNLSDVVEYANGKAHEKLADPNGDVAMVTARFISRNGEPNRFLHLEDVLTPAAIGDIAIVLSDLPNGRALARTFYVDRDDAYAINQRVARLRVKDLSLTNPRFVYHFLDRNPGLLRHDNGVDQTHLSKSQVTGLPFPVLAIDEQDRIVDILDRFRVLINDLSVGLPAELAARRKQYEYYRDRLLTFEEAVA